MKTNNKFSLFAVLLAVFLIFAKCNIDDPKYKGGNCNSSSLLFSKNNGLLIKHFVFKDSIINLSDTSFFKIKDVWIENMWEYRQELFSQWQINVNHDKYQLNIQCENFNYSNYFAYPLKISTGDFLGVSDSVLIRSSISPFDYFTLYSIDKNGNVFDSIAFRQYRHIMPEIVK